MPTTNALSARLVSADAGRRWCLIPILTLTAALIAVLISPAGVAEAKKKQRIAALTPFATQTLAKLGVRPVVIGETVMGRDGIPAKFRNVPTIPLSHSTNGPNQEQLIHYRVNVVLSERTWRAGKGALENSGMKVREYDPTKLAQFGRKIKQIGKLVGKRAKAKKLARSINKKIRKATRGISKRPKTLVLLGVGQRSLAFLPNSWGGNLFSKAGAALATDGLSSDGGSNLMISGGFAQLQPEEIVFHAPDVIVAVPHGNPEDLDDIKESLENDQILKDTNAGQNGQIYVVINNSLLQPDLRVPKVIKTIRNAYLHNR